MFLAIAQVKGWIRLFDAITLTARSHTAGAVINKGFLLLLCLPEPQPSASGSLCVLFNASVFVNAFPDRHLSLSNAFSKTYLLWSEN